MATARRQVVDDEVAVLGLVTKALSLRGYEVHSESSPLEALQFVEDSPNFDLLVTDVITPDMCGPEFGRRIAAIRQNLSGRLDVRACRLRSASRACRTALHGACYFYLISKSNS